MNKKLTLIILVFTTCFTVKAQTQKGSQLLGGSVLFGITNDKSDNVNYTNSSYNNSYKSKEISFSIGPDYSYFVANNLDLGLSLGYGTDKTTYNYSVANTSYSVLPYKNNNQYYSGGIYLRKYFLYNQKIGIRTGPYAQYQKYKYQVDYLEPQVNNNNFSQTGNYVNTGFILDIVYFPTKRIGLTSTLGTLGYVYGNSKFVGSYSNGQDKVNSFGVRFVSALNLSLVYCFGK
ncbi:MAG: hypothetical protein V5804_05785 [Mucilaginibacter sp.]|uniref:hypothetical protein n=1 Tax=Mucilaginibacter sp. TaxID=1882438 RepID=UPI0034E55AE5